jgi:hypothetical protein
MASIITLSRVPGTVLYCNTVIKGYQVPGTGTVLQFNSVPGTYICTATPSLQSIGLGSNSFTIMTS